MKWVFPPHHCSPFGLRPSRDDPSLASPWTAEEIAGATVRLTAVPPPKGKPPRRSSQGLEIFLRQRQGDAFASWPRPSVTFNAADEPLAEPVDLDQRTVAEGAGF
jgi:hypothetical protein